MGRSETVGNDPPFYKRTVKRKHEREGIKCDLRIERTGAKKRAWLESVGASDCSGEIVPFEEYGAAAEWAGVEFDENGEAY